MPFISTSLDLANQHLDRFDCGEPELNVYLLDHVATAARARVAQTFVWLEGTSRNVVGYYSLSAHAVKRADAPSRIGMGVPDPVPAALIATLALDESRHGQRSGELLLVDALPESSMPASGPRGARDRGRCCYRVRTGAVCAMWICGYPRALRPHDHPSRNGSKCPCPTVEPFPRRKPGTEPRFMGQALVHRKKGKGEIVVVNASRASSTTLPLFTGLTPADQFILDTATATEVDILISCRFRTPRCCVNSCV